MQILVTETQVFFSLFTDGSKSDGHVGSAVICEDEAFSEQIPSVASIFTAEMHAIHLALKHIRTKDHRKSLIYTESLSALQALISLKPSPHPILLHVKKLLFLLSRRGYTIKFCWIPGHVGIQGNELADIAAKSATLQQSHNCQVPFSDLKPGVRIRAPRPVRP